MDPVFSLLLIVFPEKEVEYKIELDTDGDLARQCIDL